MATLTIAFIPPAIVPYAGYVVKYRKVGTTPYTTVSPNPSASPVVITGVENGVNYEGTVQIDCGGHYTNPISFLAVGVACPTLTANFSVVQGSSDSLADVTVVPAAGTAPYTYSWSTGAATDTATGLTKNVAYTVDVTDANGCTETFNVTPNVVILQGLSMEVMYFNSTTVDTSDPYYPRSCSGGHSCNRARFEVFTNGVSQGIANMNNAGGTSVPDGTIDDLNIPPGTYASPSPSDRYWQKTLSGADALAVADPDGQVEITLVWTGNLTSEPSGPHSSAVWVRIKKYDGTVVSSSCVDAFTGYTFDPYA